MDVQANGLLMFIYRSQGLANYMAPVLLGSAVAQAYSSATRPTIGIVPKLGRFNAGLIASTACRAISGQRLTAGKMHRQPFFVLHFFSLKQDKSD